MLDADERNMAKQLLLAGQDCLLRNWPRRGINDAQKRSLVRSAAQKLDSVAADVIAERLATVKVRCSRSLSPCFVADARVRATLCPIVSLFTRTCLVTPSRCPAARPVLSVSVCCENVRDLLLRVLIKSLRCNACRVTPLRRRR